MDFLFGAEMPLAVRFLLAFVIVLALIGATAFLVRRFGAERIGGSSSRGRQPRLAVIDAAAVDGRRRLILIRRDNVEHLIMIGGPTDVVVEANISRTAATARDAAGLRPPAAAPIDTLPRAVPLGEDTMWPLQPTPEPAAAPRSPRQPAAEEPVQWHAEPEPPEPPPLPRRMEPRPELRPEPRDVRSEPRVADPLAGLAAELSRVQPEAPAPRPRPTREGARARLPLSERARAAPASAPAPADEQPDADQNLAEMAQRLEAALRRPRAPDDMARPATMSDPMTVAEPEAAAADVMAEHREAPESQQPARSAAPAKPAPQKSVYDSLEQEMASLLGRPNTKI